MTLKLPLKLSASTQLLRVFFGVLMLATGVGKALNMPGFIGVVDSYQSLPSMLIAPAAWALMLTELGLSLVLLSGRQLVVVAWLLIALHFMYLVWTAVALARGMDLPNCGCFGVYWPRPLRWYSPLEDLFLMLLAIAFWRGSLDKHRSA